jgi:hypothetical protein
MQGTIVFIKRGGELAVILSNSPAVISLRDFMYESPAEGLRLQQLAEGTSVIVHDVGSWNCKTGVFHGARMSWTAGTTCGGFAIYHTPSTPPVSTPSRPAMQTVLVNNSGNAPPRRKHRLAMVL